MIDEPPSAPGGAERPQSGALPGENAKRVDESWKAEVQREKEKLPGAARGRGGRGKAAAEKSLPAASFLQFVSGIAAQALMQLGEIENPFEGRKKVDLEAARYSIDTIAILEQKTKGNLTAEEERYLKAALHDLRMRFVEVARGSEGQGRPPSR